MARKSKIWCSHNTKSNNHRNLRRSIFSENLGDFLTHFLIIRLARSHRSTHEDALETDCRSFGLSGRRDDFDFTCRGREARAELQRSRPDAPRAIDAAHQWAAHL